MLFAAAVERETPKGFGRVRLGVIEDAGAQSLRGFLVDNVEPGSRVITDGWSSYPPATEGLYKLAPTTVSGSGMEAHELLPGPHVVFSLVKRWVLGTLQRVRLARAPAGVPGRVLLPPEPSRPTPRPVPTDPQPLRALHRPSPILPANEHLTEGDYQECRSSADDHSAYDC